jgi:hypothetical protein
VSDCTSPAHTAAVDELEAAFSAMREYVNSLDTPTLLAELRCASYRLGTVLTAIHGAASPVVVTFMAVSHLMARFDLNGDVGEREFIPLPHAVAAAEDCACDLPEEGLLGHIKRIDAATDRLKAAHG